MTFNGRDAAELYRCERRAGAKKRKYQRADGKTPCAYRYHREDPPEGEIWFCSESPEATYHVITRSEGRPRRERPPGLYGPPDIIARKRHQQILVGHTLDYSFLTPLENVILTRRALGESWKSLAKRFSGGPLRRHFDHITIKNIIGRAYTKIRIRTRPVGAVPLHSIVKEGSK